MAVCGFWFFFFYQMLASEMLCNLRIKFLEHFIASYYVLHIDM